MTLLVRPRTRPAAIDLIRTELDVVRLDGGKDYRQDRLHTSHGFGAGGWHLTLDPQTDPVSTPLNAAGHSIRARHVDGDRAEFAFEELCAQPLGTAQYLWLTERFRSIALTSVPDLATVARDPLARFANLVDVLYDRDIPIHVHAASEPQRLLLAAEPPRDAQRTVSRLSTLTVS
jgi:cell division protein ZapE